jgi:hypothetical protein
MGLSAIKHGPDRFHGSDQPARNLAVDLLQPVCPEFRLVELLRQPRPVGMGSAHLGAESSYSSLG